MDPQRKLPFKSYDVKMPNIIELYVAQREPFSHRFGTNETQPLQREG